MLYALTEFFITSGIANSLQVFYQTTSWVWRCCNQPNLSSVTNKIESVQYDTALATAVATRGASAATSTSSSISY